MSSAPAPTRPHRLDARLIVGALVFMAGCAYVVYSLVGLRQSLDAERQSQAADSTAITQLSNALTTTRQQLQQHGVTPKAAPPSEIVQGIPGVQGVPGVSVTGPAGPPGKDAPTPNATAIASLAAGMIHPSPGPSGPAGSPGQAGASGAPGQPGQDGAAGQPPAGWTYTDPQGNTYDCERVANFDPSAPRYSCTMTSSPSPTPTPSPTPGSAQSAVAGGMQAKPRPKAIVVATGPR